MAVAVAPDYVCSCFSIDVCSFMYVSGDCTPLPLLVSVIL